MEPPPGSRETRLVTRFGTQAHVAITATGRQLTYRWTAPRSPVLRAVFMPAFVGAGLLVLLVAMLVLAAFLVLAAATVVALVLVSGPRVVARRLTTFHRGSRR